MTTPHEPTKVFVGLCVFKRAKFTPPERGLALGFNRNEIWQIMDDRCKILQNDPYSFRVVEIESSMEFLL